MEALLFYFRNRSLAAATRGMVRKGCGEANSALKAVVGTRDMGRGPV